MSELKEKQISVLAVFADFLLTLKGAAPKPKAADEDEPAAEENLELDEDKILEMDIDDLKELAEKLGLEDYKKDGIKELRKKILAAGSGGEDNAGDDDAKPAKKKKKDDDEPAAAEFEVGQKVVAKWDTDGKWYKAKVLKLDEDGTGKIKVKFLEDETVQNTKIANIQPQPKE